MKGNVWKIDIGGQLIDIESFEDVIDAVEACTRAVEWLHREKMNYKIGPAILATSEGKSTTVKSDLVLANAGKHVQCEKLRNVIHQYNEKMKKKHLK